jgi:hypothetical protein
VPASKLATHQAHHDGDIRGRNGPLAVGTVRHGAVINIFILLKLNGFFAIMAQSTLYEY